MNAWSLAPCLTRRNPMKIETCPQCGGVLVDFALTVNPPIYKKVCTACGWSWAEEKEGK